MKKLLPFLLLLCPILAISQTTPQPISTFPYIEDFENGPGGWTAGALPNSNNSSWVFSTPITTITSQKTEINYAASGTGYWVTCDTSSTIPPGYFTKHKPNENSQVTSPTFDLTSLTNPEVAFKIWWQAEAYVDGAAFQYSLDSGTTWNQVGALRDPNNWYNWNVASKPGMQNAGWTGGLRSIPGSNGWVIASNSLNEVIGESHVIFRFAFKSDVSFNEEGFGFDDFMIFEAGTVVLGEKEKLKAGSLQVYPNPGSGHFQVQLPETNQPANVKVYDLKGQLVQEQTVNPSARTTELNLANAPKGIYLLKAEIGNKLYIQKLVVQ